MLATGETGFTLIETLVVVAITALIGGLMFPRLQGVVSGQEFRTARSALILGVRETRALAIRSGKPAEFRVASDAQGFQVGARPVQALPQAIALKSGGRERAITFYNDGTSNGGRLSLSGKGNRQDYIIFPTTGLIAEARQ